MGDGMSAKRLIVVGEHPSLHRGFAVVGHNIARGLQGDHQWSVDYAGLLPPAPSSSAPGYRVFDVDPAGAREEETVERLGAVLRRLVAGASASGWRPILLSIGSNHALAIDSLEQFGLRAMVDVVAYIPMDLAPIPPRMARQLARADVIVPHTAFGGRALRAACAGAERPWLAAPIPHGVDTRTFAPLSCEARREIRRTKFGIGDDGLLVGFFGRNSGHKHPDRALQIFGAFARGTYATCRVCARLTPFSRDPVDGSEEAPRICSLCGSDDLARGTADPTARLYLHTELLSSVERRLSGGWHLERLVARLGLSGQVLFDRSHLVGVGVEAAELARRMSACDVHLLPYDRGGWELTVLETAACGVANIITDVSAPPEYAAPFSMLVPTLAQPFGPYGSQGVIDFGGAIGALARLAADPPARQQLGRRGSEVARASTGPGSSRRGTLC